MPDQHKPGGPALSRELKATAHAKATEAVQSIVAGLGGRTVLEVRSRSLTWPGVNGTEPEPLASLEAARELERAAHALQLDIIRLSREGGRSWAEIGDSLDLHWEAAAAKESIADMAYDYALSYQPDPAPGRRTFTWTCPACQQPITRSRALARHTQSTRRAHDRLFSVVRPTRSVAGQPGKSVEALPALTSAG